MLPSLHRIKIHQTDVRKKAFVLAASPPFVQLKYHVVMNNHIYGEGYDACEFDGRGADEEEEANNSLSRGDMDGSSTGGRADGSSAGGGAVEGGGNDTGNDTIDFVCDDAMELETPPYEAVELPRKEGTQEANPGPVPRTQLINWFLDPNGGAKYVGVESKLKITAKGCSSIFILFIDQQNKIVTYFKTPSGSYEIRDDDQLIPNIYNNSRKWYVNLNAIPKTFEEFQSGYGRGQTKRARMAARFAIGAPTGPPPVEILNPDLWAEYETHCLWLRMQLVPCNVNPTAIENIKNTVQLKEHLKKLSKGEWRPIHGLITGEEFSADEIWKENYDTPDKDIVDMQVGIWDRTPNCKLNHKQFPNLGAGHYGRGGDSVGDTDKYVSWLRFYMVNTTGPVYKGGRLKTISRRDLVTNHQAYQIEHITPQSWTPLTTLVNMFRYVVSDPTMVGFSWGNTNQARGNKALLFGTNSEEDGLYMAWPLVDGKMAAHVARAVIHATMTYPLLTNNENVLGRGDVTAVTPIRAYFDQIDTIIELATSPPEKWEIMITMQCYVRFGTLNPLVVSSDTRQRFRDRNDPFYKLLRARWSGNDKISRVLLDTVKGLVDKPCV